MFDDSTRRRFVAGLVSACAAGLAGCLGGRPVEETGSSGKTGDSGEQETETAETPTADAPTVSDAARERLDAGLVGLVEAEDRAAYADREELPYDDGRVRVVVELRAGAELPSSPSVAVERRHDSLVEGRVAVADLPALATADGVAFVRPPQSPVTGDVASRAGPFGEA